MLNLYVSLVLLDVSFTMLPYNLLCLVIFKTVLRWIQYFIENSTALLRFIDFILVSTRLD